MANSGGSIFEYYRQLVRLRKEYPVLVDGAYQLLMEDDEQVFAYIRDDGKNRLLVACNFTDREADCPVLAEWEGQKLLIGNYPERKGEKLRPYEARMYLE